MENRKNVKFTKYGEILCSYIEEKDVIGTTLEDKHLPIDSNYGVFCEDLEEHNGEIVYDDEKIVKCQDIVEGSVLDYGYNIDSVAKYLKTFTPDLDWDDEYGMFYIRNYQELCTVVYDNMGFKKDDITLYPLCTIKYNKKCGGHSNRKGKQYIYRITPHDGGHKGNSFLGAWVFDEDGYIEGSESMQTYKMPKHAKHYYRLVNKTDVIKKQLECIYVGITIAVAPANHKFRSSPSASEYPGLSKRSERSLEICSDGSRTMVTGWHYNFQTHNRSGAGRNLVIRVPKFVNNNEYAFIDTSDSNKFPRIFLRVNDDITDKDIVQSMGYCLMRGGSITIPYVRRYKIWSTPAADGTRISFKLGDLIRDSIESDITEGTTEIEVLKN